MSVKVKILTYECKKCNKLVYLISNEEYSTQCKICKNQMTFRSERNYNPKNGLRAIEASKASSNISAKKDSIVECPYCHSTNTKKISEMSKTAALVLFGVFALGRTSKQWHCNDCGSDF